MRRAWCEIARCEIASATTIRAARVHLAQLGRPSSGGSGAPRALFNFAAAPPLGNIERRSDRSTMPRKAAVIFIFITVTLDMLALGLIMPVLPKLVLEFSRRRRAECGEDVRHFRHGLRADAVCFFAGARGVVGSLRAAAGDPAFEPRAGPRLHCDGAGADARLAFCRAGHFGNHRREHHDRDGVCGGCGRAGKTGGGLRIDWRGVRGWVCPRPGAGRAARRIPIRGCRFGSRAD